MHTVLFIRQITYLPAFIVLGGWFLLQVFSNMNKDSGGDGVAYLAHIGGFVCGIVLLPILSYLSPTRREVEADILMY